jgi:NADPH:quinone reductase-like Zn-dependent oxidoreductase
MIAASARHEAAATRQMKAVVQDHYGSADALRLLDVDVPSVPDDGVLVRVHASSINAVDWHEMTGSPVLVRVMAGWRKPRQRVRGTDVAGVVEAVGKDVTELRPGDEVFGTRGGALAEYVLGRVRNFVPKPANLAFEEAAAVPVAALTALQAVRDKAAIQPGQRVVVNGAGGGVGSFTVQIAHAFGAHVTATTRPENVEMLQAVGADEVLDHTAADFTRRGQRYDAIFDLGGRSLVALRRALTSDGKAVLIGEPNPRMALLVPGLAAAAVLSRVGGRTFRSFLATAKRDDFLTLRDLAEARKLRPVIDRTYPLSEAAEAFRYFGMGRVRGKVVVTI